MAPSLRELLFDPQPFCHLFVEETFAGTVGLDPFSINYKLRDGALARPLHDLIGGSRSGLDVDVRVRKLVPVEKALGLAAIGTPKGRVNGDFPEVRYSGFAGSKFSRLRKNSGSHPRIVSELR